MMDLLPLSLLCLLKPFRHVGCAGSSTPSTEYLWHSAPLGGAEVWNRRSASRHQLMAQDDLVLSHGPVCPSPFASALDEVCALPVEVKVRLLQCVDGYSGERRQPL